VGTPTCHSMSSYSIPFHLTALLPLSVPQSTHTDLVNGSLTTTENTLSFPPPPSTSTNKENGPLQTELPSGSQVYQLYKTVSGRAGDRNKGSPFGPTRCIRLKNRLRRQWQITRDPALKAEVNRLQKPVTRRLNEWSNDQWSATLESLDSEDTMEDDQADDERSYSISSPPWSPQGQSLSQTLRKQKPLQTIWRLSFSRRPILRSWQLLRRLTWRRGLTP